MLERPFSSAYDPDAARLVLSGSVDELAAPVFRDDLAAALSASPQGLEVDLSDVDYFPSVAVSALIKALRQDGDAASSELLAAPGTVAQRVLQICGLPHRTS